MERWAHGRLPSGARGLSETQDIVQITLVRVLDQVGRFEARRPGAFLAYLRRSLLNNLRNEIRSASRRPSSDSLDVEAVVDPGPSPLEKVIGRKALDGYEAALEKLNDEQKAAVIMKLELGCGHQEIADLLGSPSPNAARMVVSRALVRLATLIDKESLRDEA
jgi:RNA polymerase sigma-70 factor (ECF subfamily)